MLDDYYEVDAAGAKTTSAHGTADRVNLVEMLMWSLNEGFRASNNQYTRTIACTCWKLNDGRLTIALGLIGENSPANLAPAPGIPAPIGSDFYYSGFGNIGKVEFNMNHQIAMLFGFALRREGWFEPEQKYSLVDGGPIAPDPFQDIPEDPITGIGFLQRGGIIVDYVGAAATGGNIWLMQAERPMKPIGPSILFVEVHTTGVECRSLSHVDEKACWSLVVNNGIWVSGRANTGARECNDPYDGVTHIDDPLKNIQTFYPAGLKYRDRNQWAPNPTGTGNDTHTFSWVHPNWAFTSVPKATIQDLAFTVLDGDTQEPMNMFSGAGTQFSIILSP